MQAYPPIVAVRVLRDAFFPFRGLAPAPRGLGAERGGAFDDDRVISDMEQFGYVRLDALRAAPRGRRDWVVALVLAADGKYAHHSPDLRRLLDAVETERPAKEGRLDELLVVAEEAFFGKKNLTDVIREAQRRQAGGADAEGAAPFYGAYPYCNFSCVVPSHVSVPAHRLMAPGEVADFLRTARLDRADLPMILTTDAAMVWAGGRAGQVVEITRDSATAGTALYYRRVEKGAV